MVIQVIGMYFFQVAHMAHILIMVHADDGAAGGQNSKALKESMRHHMEHRNRVSRSAQGHGHIAQLRQSRDKPPRA